MTHVSGLGSGPGSGPVSGPGSAGRTALPRLIAVLPAIMLLGACSLANHEVPEKAATFDSFETRVLDLPAFEALDLDADALIEVRQGDKQSVVLSTQPDHFEHLDIRVEAGVLMIDHEGHRGRRHVKLEIVTPTLSAISVNSVVDASFIDIRTDSMRIYYDGIGDFVLTGKCRDVTYDISSIGEFNARRFECQNASADISGIGDASIFASETLSLSVSGIGDVNVFGNPRVEKMKARGIGSTSIR